ncbi:Enoyl-CoA hydratase/carnithine racemase [Pseudoduganella namucuonensis]|uniref:3-hydroxyisobutyryl-CoA hydrolase n=2 Tax=Pseudoduganella namucuonensis TaxID=1035707 RepID=A0A1I7M7K0_9BURK|nr:Enoyl-CoA hydratase/carnithine racemase [Pseudoduganella namucuonensis]
MEARSDPRSGAPVLAHTLRADNGRLIGVLTLNSEKTLNALSLAMIDLLSAQLSAWAGDERVAMVLMRGAGDKAFCAGGDLQELYASMLAHRDSARRGDVLGNGYANDFFGREYRLDYQIHTYPKPILCWGHGIVMGGGIGLMAGARHRVATEKTRLAMPEIGIGLFPDVGGSWFLSRMPGGLGLFLALTGAAVNAADARHVGLADRVLAHADQPRVIESLQRQPWGDDGAANDRLLGAVLRDAEQAQAVPPAAGPLRRHQELIGGLCGHDTLERVLAAFAECRTDDAWLAKAVAAPARGAPGSLSLAWRLLERAPYLSLADVFRMEYGVALHCAAHGDFAEGIRALLIDKDMQPAWRPASATDHFLDSPWAPLAHPLANLHHQNRRTT